MNVILPLWLAIALQTWLLGVSLNTRSWMTLVGQAASLVLLGFVAWKVHDRTRPPCRRSDDTTGGS